MTPVIGIDHKTFNCDTDERSISDQEIGLCRGAPESVAKVPRDTSNPSFQRKRAHLATRR